MLNAHAAGRKLVDWNRSLWSSWVVEHIAQIDKKPGSTPPDSELPAARKAGNTRTQRQAVFFGG
jgi:hypothetical protein